jgi:hypothetical protein
MGSRSSARRALTRRPFPWRRLARDSAVIVGLAWFVVGWGILHYRADWFTDALAYYRVNPGMPYGASTPGIPGIFTYSPVAAQVFVVLGRIPEPMFLGGWLALNLGILFWLVRATPWVALALAAPIADEIITGQVEFVLAAAIVLGIRRPAFWAIPLLTKVTPGVGVLWFAVRRKWRPLVTALTVSGALALISFAIAPTWWAAWVDFLRASAAGDAHQLPVVRFVIAAILVVWAARTDRAWVLPVAAILALPVVWLHSLSMLAAVPMLRRLPQSPP